MKLQTQIPLRKQPDSHIEYHSKLILLGSCFAETMSEKFEYYKFQAATNPFGIIFNPLSIEKLIIKSIQKAYFTDADVFCHNEQWHSYDIHSKLSHPSKEELLKQLNDLIDLTATQLHNATHIIITLGTAWVYKLNNTGQVVANCHKMPQNYFTKGLLSIQELSESLHNIVENIKRINPKTMFIFTVSPVRHIKDGFIENTLSKSHLISAIHQFLYQQALINNLQLSYFPAFELMMDELRDYRFYADDMLHPNKTAVDYIWEKFKDVWIHPETYSTMELVDTVQKGLLHKPFNPEAQAHLAFIENIEAKKRTLQKQFSHIVF